MDKNKKYKEDPLTGERVNFGFTGIWISEEIFFDDKINWIEKIMIGHIQSLSKGLGGCFASNKYFAKMYGVTETSISISISKLKKLGYIKQISFDGRKRILEVKINK